MRNLFEGKPPLYLISDTTISNLSHREVFKIAIRGGVKVIQLREKYMTKKEIYKEAMVIRRITKRHGITFIINDYVDLAYIVDADGVHLGQDDIPLREARRILGMDKIIGVSTHTLKQAIDAENGGADYIGYGPIFHTATKDAGRPKGVGLLKEIRGRVNIPIVAIGGITLEDLKVVLDTGVDAVAMLSGILKGNIRENIKRFMAISGLGRLKDWKICNL
ncbi:MAG: thiamine phosphate synthase [Thermodesulfovibrionia bacterium]